VVKGGVAKLYPYQILAWHEVVNDEIGGTPLAATYCALCNVGVIYSRQVQGAILSFGVSGKLEDFDSLLFDRDSQSLWSQVTGKAITGPRRGQTLAQIESEVMTLRQFAEAYPRGVVLSKFTGYVRNYDTLAYGDYAAQENGDKIIMRKGLVHPKTEVVGVGIGEKFKAYPVEVVKEQGGMEDVVNGTKVKLTIAGDGDGGAINGVALQRAQGLRGNNAEAIPVLQTYWFMWQLYHPDSMMYK
jgi:hypothetical protein